MFCQSLSSLLANLHRNPAIIYRTTEVTLTWVRAYGPIVIQSPLIICVKYQHFLALSALYVLLVGCPRPELWWVSQHQVDLVCMCYKGVTRSGQITVWANIAGYFFCWELSIALEWCHKYPNGPCRKKGSSPLSSTLANFRWVYIYIFIYIYLVHAYPSSKPGIRSFNNLTLEKDYTWKGSDCVTYFIVI